MNTSEKINFFVKLAFNAKLESETYKLLRGSFYNNVDGDETSRQVQQLIGQAQQKVEIYSLAIKAIGIEYNKLTEDEKIIFLNKLAKIDSKKSSLNNKFQYEVLQTVISEIKKEINQKNKNYKRG